MSWFRCSMVEPSSSAAVRSSATELMWLVPLLVCTTHCRHRWACTWAAVPCRNAASWRPPLCCRGVKRPPPKSSNSPSPRVRSTPTWMHCRAAASRALWATRTSTQGTSALESVPARALLAATAPPALRIQRPAALEPSTRPSKGRVRACASPAREARDALVAQATTNYVP